MPVTIRALSEALHRVRRMAGQPMRSHQLLKLKLRDRLFEPNRVFAVRRPPGRRGSMGEGGPAAAARAAPPVAVAPRNARREMPRRVPDSISSLLMVAGRPVNTRRQSRTSASARRAGIRDAGNCRGVLVAGRRATSRHVRSTCRYARMAEGRFGLYARPSALRCSPPHLWGFVRTPLG
jgi:hypothetical protein